MTATEVELYREAARSPDLAREMKTQASDRRERAVARRSALPPPPWRRIPT